ncbi:MAG: HAMP domain-containing histidine kinase [Lachnospiraceae bacterium]|nr:HAMP domain-containing histidine kinase [Lachnospiraceae bacterium]
MTFKQKISVTFAISVILPMLLIIAAYVIIGGYLQRATGGAPAGGTVYDNSISYVRNAQHIIDEKIPEIREDPEWFTNEENVREISARLEDEHSYLIARRQGEVIYSGSPEETAKYVDRLPIYGAGIPGRAMYMEDFNMLVEQHDFTYTDGSEGTIFSATRVVTQISRTLLTAMLVAMVGILALTGFLLTRWLSGSVFTPIRDLNTAMNQIRDGNLEFMLETDEKGEIGELYQNYEDMRLRLKESADEKLFQEQQNRELISNISHDLKTPITTIKGYVEGLLDGVANTPEKQEKYLRTVASKANDMDKLINELTLYSRIDSDRIPYNFQPVNVSGYFRDCVEEIGLDLEERGIILNFVNMIQPDTMIIADPEQLKRVVNNIVGNSVKYIDKTPGRIEIRLLDEQDSVRVEIEDNGKGIAPRDLPNIFDRFYRTDSSRNSLQGGSGIGLSIVKKIIEDHGGYIWATSREGEGTCMHFVIRKYRFEETDGVDVVEDVETV